MLFPADEILVRRDPDIPGLKELLDPAAFAETLRRIYPAADITAAEPKYVRYKPGTSCLVGYAVTAGGACLDLYARAHGAGTTEKIAKAAQRESVPSPLGDGIKVLADDAVVVYPYPNDHELQALSVIEEPAARREMLADLFPDRQDLWEAPIEVLRYKPERRCVIRLGSNDRGGDAVLKLYTKEDYLLRKENVDTFVSLPPLRVPRRLGRSRRFHLAALEWLEGEPLVEAMAAAPDAADPGRAVGAALSRLHVQKPKKLTTTWTADRYAAALSDGAAAIAEIAPRLGERAAAIARRIGEKLTTRHWRANRSIHGDCAAEQMLLQDATVAVVDFDRAGYGDPRIDLGTFRGRLLYDVMVGVLERHRADACFEGLLDEYRAESKKDVTRKLDRFTAASLLQLAVEPFRLRRRDWSELLEQILDEADRLTRGGGSGA